MPPFTRSRTVPHCCARGASLWRWGSTIVGAGPAVDIAAAQSFDEGDDPRLVIMVQPIDATPCSERDPGIELVVGRQDHIRAVAPGDEVQRTELVARDIP